MGRRNGDAVADFSYFRERRTSFSLDFQLIGPSDFFLAKKESCSTQRGLHVDTNLGEFRQTSCDALTQHPMGCQARVPHFVTETL